MMAQKHKWNMADTITSARMVFSLFLLFMPPRFIGFFCRLYPCRPDGRAGRLAGEKDRDGQRVRSETGQHG